MVAGRPGEHARPATPWPTLWSLARLALAVGVPGAADPTGLGAMWGSVLGTARIWSVGAFWPLPRCLGVHRSPPVPVGRGLVGRSLTRSLGSQTGTGVAAQGPGQVCLRLVHQLVGTGYWPPPPPRALGTNQ